MTNPHAEAINRISQHLASEMKSHLALKVGAKDTDRQKYFYHAGALYALEHATQKLLKIMEDVNAKCKSKCDN